MRILALMWLVLAACSDGDELTVHVDSGTLHGANVGGIRHWLGIPYAAPPVGALRWRAPQPVDAWSGVREALEVGAQCPQTLSYAGPSYEEDCLYLNVWAPPGAHDLPVMVWLHGGAFVFGSGGDRYYDGASLASRGVIVVTLNYRLGAFGFLAHPALDAEDAAYPTSGNYGLEDQRAALAWVQRNIAAFGGSPAKVTLFGESAGGFSVCVHYLSSRTQDLFARAISESGLCTAPVLEVTHAQAELDGQAIGAKLGCSGSDASALACLRAVDSKTLLDATNLPPPASQTPGGPFYQASLLPGVLPNVDGFVIERPQRLAVMAGGYAKRPLILGTNEDEGTLFHSSIYATEVTTEQQIRDALAVRFGAAAVDPILAHYPLASYASPNAALAQITGDAFFVCPARRFARGTTAAVGAPTFRYSFEHAPAAPFMAGLGVFHSAEIPFVFGNDTYPLEQIGGATALVDAMQTAWTSFAKTGAPGDPWAAYDATEPYTRIVDAPVAATALATTACDFWDSL